MIYRATKENDGTYSIQESTFGLNWCTILLGVRGCNVLRTIRKLYKLQPRSVYSTRPITKE